MGGRRGDGNRTGGECWPAQEYHLARLQTAVFQAGIPNPMLTPYPHAHPRRRSPARALLVLPCPAAVAEVRQLERGGGTAGIASLDAFLRDMGLVVQVSTFLCQLLPCAGDGWLGPGWGRHPDSILQL